MISRTRVCSVFGTVFSLYRACKVKILLFTVTFLTCLKLMYHTMNDTALDAVDPLQTIYMATSMRPCYHWLLAEDQIGPLGSPLYLQTSFCNDRLPFNSVDGVSKRMNSQPKFEGTALPTSDIVGLNVRRWEKDGKYSRAACWLVFTRQFTRAIELLMRSEGRFHFRSSRSALMMATDESHHMMSGTLAALSSHSSVSASRSAELQKHCEHLIVKLQDPYFRAMLTSLTMGDWSDVLSEEVLPFRERLAIAFQFLDDKGLTSYLRSCRGDIDSLIVTGLTKSGMDILQSYIDRTGDIQTGAILVSYVNPWKFRDVRGERWLEGYRDLLDGFKLHHYRVAFDIDYGNILQAAIFSGDIEPFTWVPSQILIRCHYCNKPVTVPGSVVTQKAGKVRLIIFICFTFEV